MIIKKEAIIFRDIESVFNIVNRVDLYKNFVPHCIESEILSEESDEMIAKLNFNFKSLSTSFTTKNVVKKYSSIDLQLIEGPFKHLDGKWEFKEIEDTTIIFLTIDYKAKNKIIEYAIGKSLEKITNTLVRAFVKEATK